MDENESARNLAESIQKARRSFGVVACLSLLWGLGEFVANDDASAFFGFLAASIMAVIIRHILGPCGPAELLRAFGYRGMQ